LFNIKARSFFIPSGAPIPSGVPASGKRGEGDPAARPSSLLPACGGLRGEGQDEGLGGEPKRGGKPPPRSMNNHMISTRANLMAPKERSFRPLATRPQSTTTRVPFATR
jgi:hypothetical protein